MAASISAPEAHKALMAYAAGSSEGRSWLLVAKAGGEIVYYSGRAGPAWVSPEAADAFPMGESEAKSKAELFNGRSALHGLKFSAWPKGQEVQI